MCGSSLTLQITLIQEGETFQMRVDNVIKRDREVCVESLSHLAHNGTHVDSVSPRRFYLVCTSGQVVIMQVRVYLRDHYLKAIHFCSLYLLYYFKFFWTRDFISLLIKFLKKFYVWISI